MNSVRFSLKLLFFLIILSLFGAAFFWSLGSSHLIITKLVLLVIFFAVFFLLLKYINKTNRDLSKFLEAIKYLDNVSLGNSSDLAYDQLNTTYSKITDQLKKAWLAREYEHQYFQYTLDNIGVGVISFDEKGTVEILNKAARKILGVNKLNNIKDLNTASDLTGDKLRNLKPDESKLIKLNGTLDQFKILVKSSDIKIASKRLNLITLQDIKTQLEQSELEAWQKLIKVLTHEIMNSVTPVKSLTYSMQKVLKSADDSDTKEEKLLKGLNAIEKRSRGLLEFVESYKDLTRIRKPSYERIVLKDVLGHVTKLFEEEFSMSEIDVHVEVNPDELSVIADEKLISQVIINLIQNAMKALKNSNRKEIKIRAGISDQEKIFVSIYDNGCGIDSEIMDKIFVPFFSTTEGGAGIGLSFARQVMVLHNGEIRVHSGKGAGTEFILTF